MKTKQSYSLAPYSNEEPCSPLTFLLHTVNTYTPYVKYHSCEHRSILVTIATYQSGLIVELQRALHYRFTANLPGLPINTVVIILALSAVIPCWQVSSGRCSGSGNGSQFPSASVSRKVVMVQYIQFDVPHRVEEVHVVVSINKDEQYTNITFSAFATKQRLLSEMLPLCVVSVSSLNTIG